MVYWLYRLGILIVSHLPEWIVYYIADLLGAAAYHLNREKRRIIKSNLNVVFSKIPAGLIQRIFCNYAHYYATLLRFFVLKDKEIDRLIKVDGWENLERALQDGRGAILVTAHLGHWDLGGAVLARRFKTNVVVEHLPSERLFGLYTKLRTSQGMKVITTTNIFQLHTALRRGEVVVLLSDRDMDGKGVAIPFFGRMTTMPRGPAALARKTGAPILPAFVIKERGRESYSVLIEEELKILKSEDKKRDIELATLMITQVIEGHIKRHPDNWYMFQPIWRDEG